MIKLKLKKLSCRPIWDSDRDGKAPFRSLELCLGVSPRIESYKILINLTLQGVTH